MKILHTEASSYEENVRRTIERAGEVDYVSVEGSEGLAKALSVGSPGTELEFAL